VPAVLSGDGLDVNGADPDQFLDRVLDGFGLLDSEHGRQGSLRWPCFVVVESVAVHPQEAVDAYGAVGDRR
jgi:hypothetical protein